MCECCSKPRSAHFREAVFLDLFLDHVSRVFWARRVTGLRKNNCLFALLQMVVVVVKAEEYDGTYECVICSESVRGEPALKCAQCNANPVHVACVDGSIYAEACSVCKREMMEPFGSSCREVETEAQGPTLASGAADEAEGERVKKRQLERAPPHQETCQQLGAMDPQSQEAAMKRAKTRRQRCHTKRRAPSWGQWIRNRSRRL